MQEINLCVTCSESVRIDKYIADNVDDLTRNAVINLISSGCVFKNENKVSKSEKVALGDVITINMPDPVCDDAKPENIPLDIIYEDDDLLVVNKPKGMVVHPAPGNYNGTLVNALLYHCGDSLSGINGVIRPGIVHRIDKDTSGLLIIAKNDAAHNFLAEQIKVHSFKREYEAVVCGKMRDDIGTVNAPISRHPIKRKQMAVIDKNSKSAVTHYEVLQRFDNYTHIKLKLETGRTHQIRVHMAHLGKPVAGDPVYGNTKPISGFVGQCLHAKTIGFIHPNGNYMEFTSDLPEYFQKFLDKLSRM